MKTTILSLFILMSICFFSCKKCYQCTQKVTSTSAGGGIDIATSKDEYCGTTMDKKTYERNRTSSGEEYHNGVLVSVVSTCECN